jgi:hypothetical protein
MDTGLCQPSLAILLVSIAGVIYHTAVGDFYAVTWWTIAGLAGTGIFQALCFGGLEPVAWVLMFIPVLIVCFFMAVALFASRMRINNIMSVPCRGKNCSDPDTPKPKPRCNRTRCEACNGCGCGQCQHQLQQAQLNTGLLYNQTNNIDGRDQGLETHADNDAE